MESIGQILKAARERRQISVADVVAATKMTSVFVKAIEADDFGALVAPIYARGFIKLYAVCVGLDPMPLLKKFDVALRTAPTLAPAPSKAPSVKPPEAYAGKPTPPNLQQSGAGLRQGVMVKPEQEKIGSRPKTVSGAELATATSLRVGAHAPVPLLPPSWMASLLAGRLSLLNRLFSVHVPWPRFSLPGRLAYDTLRNNAGKVLPSLPLPAIAWRRIFIVALVIMLVITASLAWDWSHRGPPATTDACRWLAEPPAPYLTVETSPAPSIKTPNTQRQISNAE